jgi:hypothetical protein
MDVMKPIDFPGLLSGYMPIQTLPTPDDAYRFPYFVYVDDKFYDEIIFEWLDEM